MSPRKTNYEQEEPKKGNAVVAVSHETRGRINAYVEKYNEGKPVSERINAKDLMALLMDTVERSNIDLKADVLNPRANPVPPPQIDANKMAEEIKADVLATVGEHLTKSFNAFLPLLEYVSNEKQRKEQRRKLLAAPTPERNEATETQIMGRVLSSMREKHGLSKADVTSRTGLSNKVINGLEGGAGKPYLQSFLQYASMFDVTELMNEYLKQKNADVKP